MEGDEDLDNPPTDDERDGLMAASRGFSRFLLDARLPGATPSIARWATGVSTLAPHRPVQIPCLPHGVSRLTELLAGP